MRRVLAVVMVMMGLGACAPDLPQPTPTFEAVITLTPDTPAITPVLVTARPLTIHTRPTLPPTWTPTFTPTATDTPTITPTSTITPTPSAIPEADLCAAFQITQNKDGRVYRLDEKVFFNVYMPLEGVTIAFRATNDVTDDVITATLADNPFYRLTIDPARLPASARYDWTMIVSTSTLKNKCRTVGYFIVDKTLPEATDEATSEATAEATHETTAEATLEAIAEMTAEVTSESTVEATRPAAPRSTPTRTRQTPTPVPTPTRRR